MRESTFLLPLKGTGHCFNSGSMSYKQSASYFEMVHPVKDFLHPEKIVMNREKGRFVTATLRLFMVLISSCWLAAYVQVSDRRPPQTESGFFG